MLLSIILCHSKNTNKTSSQDGSLSFPLTSIFFENISASTDSSPADASSAGHFVWRTIRAHPESSLVRIRSHLKLVFAILPCRRYTIYFLETAGHPATHDRMSSSLDWASNAPRFARFALHERPPMSVTLAVRVSSQPSKS